MYQEWIVWPTVRQDLLSSIKEPRNHLEIGTERTAKRSVIGSLYTLNRSQSQCLCVCHSVCVSVCAIACIILRMSIV